MLITYACLLIFSTTINLSVLVYVFFSPLLKHCFGKSNCAIAERVIRLFDEKPPIARRFFRDQVFSGVSFTCGVLLLAASDVCQKPFVGTSEAVLAVFAFNLGHYVYRFFQDVLLRKFVPLFKINVLHHVVTISTYTVFILYKQNAVSGVIGLLFEGSAIIFDICGFLKALGINKNSLIYISFMAIGFVVTILFRGICPVTVLIIVTLAHNPLNMEYLPLGFFFMNIVFFSMVNGWLVKSSMDSLKRGILSRRIINELQRTRVIRNLNRAQSPGDFELNNLGDSRQTQRQPITVAIPVDENFRLARPVSNLNMDYSRTPVSNITVSRHERTLPSFNIIINDTPIVSSEAVPSTLSP